METKNRHAISLENMDDPQISDLIQTRGQGFGYDLSYLLGYGFALMVDFMGDHTSQYGLAFK